MRFSLASMARRASIHRRTITFRPILTTQAQATDLAAVLRRMIRPWLVGRRRLEQAYEHELARTLQRDSVDDLTALFEALGEEVERLVVELTPSLRDWAMRTERWHRGRWAGTVLSGAGVDLTTALGPVDAIETIEAFLARNTALVKDVSHQAQGRIADAVLRGIQARTPARDVGRDIANAIGMARKRANRIAADQAVKLSAALDRERQRQAGLDTWKWKHSHKLHPRPAHVARDGKLYSESVASETKLASGQTVHPVPDDLPSELPFCGCVAQAVLILDGELLG